ncbi:MAG: hypothetical protein V3W34_00090 [Phycisphaerae bacterium]
MAAALPWWGVCAERTAADIIYIEASSIVEHVDDRESAAHVVGPPVFDWRSVDRWEFFHLMEELLREVEAMIMEALAHSVDHGAKPTDSNPWASGAGYDVATQMNWSMLLRKDASVFEEDALVFFEQPGMGQVPWALGEWTPSVLLWSERQAAGTGTLLADRASPSSGKRTAFGGGESSGGRSWERGLSRDRMGSTIGADDAFGSKYYLDWPWSTREGTNLIYLVVGPPASIICISIVLSALGGLRREET